MLYWIRYPFIRITISFAAGIVFNYFIDFSPRIQLGVLGGACVLYLLLWMYGRKIRFHRLNIIISFLGFAIIFLLGSLCLHYRDFTSKKKHIAYQKICFNYYLAKAINPVDSSGKFDKLLVKIRYVRGDSLWAKTEGKVLLYISDSANINYGDLLIIKGKPDMIKPPLNPDEFDYRKYMRNKGILYQHFIKADDFVIIDKVPGSLIIRISIKARMYITRLLIRNFKDKSTQGIMLALLTGQRFYIDREIYDHFINMGIIHVLAVSGLHVGIIYLFLLAILKPLYRKKWGRRFSLCIKIVVLLFFAFLTGLSPSVLRATLMFSSMIISKMLNRNSHILNSVFLSACILLSINPLLIFDVGFQLSYSAVIGIIAFQPIIYGTLQHKIKFVDWVWQLTAVSIAAQLGTLPFSLLYFKQFPTYFLLGNIFAIPYVTISITMGMILLFVSPIKLLAEIIVWLLQFLTKIFLYVITNMQLLPFGKISPIDINIYQSILLFFLILSVFLLFSKRNRRFIFFSMICVLGIILIDFHQYFNLQNEKKIIVYHIPDQSCVELVENRNGVMLIQNSSETLKSRIDYHTGNHITDGKRTTTVLDMFEFANQFPCYVEDGILFFIWNGISIAVIYDKCNIESLRSVPLDYLIISNNTLRTEDFLKMRLNADQVIWDASNSFKRSDLNDFQNNTAIHHVRINGPYIQSIKDQHDSPNRNIHK